MKVTFASTWDSQCGIATYSQSLAAELEKHVSIERLSLDAGAISTHARLAAQLNLGDVAHIQHQYPFFGGMALHRNWFRQVVSRIRVPLIVTVHELDLGDSDLRPIRSYKRWFNRHLFCPHEIYRLVVHSSEYQDKLSKLGIPKHEIRVIPEGVPYVQQPDILSEEAKSALGFPGKRVVTIFGFVVKRKGYEVALEALRHWPEDVVLLIAGGPHPGDRTGFFDRLKKRISREGLSERVSVTGYLPEKQLQTAMAATDVILAPFTSMSNSGSILRSMAYRKPIVASDLSWTHEINERRPCLSLFKVGDSIGLTEKVAELLEFENRLSEAASAVRSYAEFWNVGRAATEMVSLYKELLQE